MFQNFLCLLFLFSSLDAFESANIVVEANSRYKQGMASTTLLERKQAFNQALTLYLEIEQIHSPSAHLYAAIADTFYHLEAYPWSILYNYRALKLRPGNELIKKHLFISQAKLGISEVYEKPFFDFLSFEPYFSLKQKLRLFFYLCLATFAVASFLIWHPIKFIRSICYTFFLLSAVLFISLIYSYYFAPIEGILISPTGLYSQPGFNQPQLDQGPLVKGLKVQVLGTTNQGHWLKISANQGMPGFISSNSVRIISK